MDDKITIGLTVLGSFTALMIFIAYALNKGRKYYEEDKKLN